MVWSMEKRGDILRRLRDITKEVEILDHGVCDLEAKQLQIKQSQVVTSEMRSSINFLTALNNNTAALVQKSLREIEDMLHDPLDDDLESKALVQQFVTVLQASIRVLQEHRSVQQSYVDEFNANRSFSPHKTLVKPKNLENSQKLGDRKSPLEKFFWKFFYCSSCIEKLY